MRSSFRLHMVRGLAAALSVTMAVLVASCGDDEPYDTSCSADTDCAVVPISQQCSCESCRRTTINRSELDRYQEDREDSEPDCNDAEEVCTGLPCVEPTAFCANNNCALR